MLRVFQARSPRRGLKRGADHVQAQLKFVRWLVAQAEPDDVGAVAEPGLHGHHGGAKAAQRVERLRSIFPAADLASLRRGVWLGIETANAMIELIAEREWEVVGESRQATIEAAAALLAHHYWALGGAVS